MLLLHMAGETHKSWPRGSPVSRENGLEKSRLRARPCPDGALADMGRVALAQNLNLRCRDGVGCSVKVLAQKSQRLYGA